MIKVKKKLFKFIYSMLIAFAPKNRVGDKLISLLHFIQSHRRLPIGNRFSDILYKIKVSNEILNVLRQYTSDKEYVKIYIKNIVGDDFNVKTKAILNSPEEVSKYKFIVGDVIKPTHASGLVEFVTNCDIDDQKISKWLDINYYEISREANYRYLRPKIIVEEAVFGRFDVDDIKFFCVNGKAKVIQWDFDRHVSHTRMLYDTAWKSLNASLGYPKSTKVKIKPNNLDQMIAIVEKLAAPFNFVRIDLYCDNLLDKFYVGEITHCHGSSNERFDSEESERRITKILFDPLN